MASSLQPPTVNPSPILLASPPQYRSMDRRIRVRTGCITCRRRRVKCDEAKPSCARCRAANFICGGYNPPRPGTDTSSPQPLSRSSPQRNSRESSSEIHQDLAWRHANWRQEELPLYHHFITTTVVRLFRHDHVDFWRDQVAQMSYGVDIVYEALLAIGAMHRASLLQCQSRDPQVAAKLKVLGLNSYGNALRLLPGHLGQNSVPDILAILAVLMLLAYFECLMENPRGALRHLWAAIQLARSSEARLSEVEASNMVPVYDAMLRLDFLAQKLIPYSCSSFLRLSDRAMLERPFWSRPSIAYHGVTPKESINDESYRQIQIIDGHNKLSRVVWGCWCPIPERPTRDELLGFFAEMQLWKSNSPATYASCEGLDLLEALDPTTVDTYSIPPPACRFSSNEAALNFATANCYLGCTVAMLSTTDPDPWPRELEAFNLVYQILCIAAGLIESDKENIGRPYKPCDAVNMGISTLLFHGARRCYSLTWQEWTILALRSIGREGLSNGFTLANTLEIMCQLQSQLHRNNIGQLGEFSRDSYLGSIRSRLIPLLMPVSDNGDILAFYLRYGHTELDDDENAIQVVARASWKQELHGEMMSLKVDVYDPAFASGAYLLLERPRACDLFYSWRQAVEGGWHGYLSSNIQEGFIHNRNILSA